MRKYDAMRAKSSSLQGQVLVEYLLMIVVALGLIIMIQSTLRKTTFELWKTFSCDVVAACPGCPYNGVNNSLRCSAR